MNLRAVVQPQGLASVSLAPATNQGLWLLLLPVELRADQGFITATDVRVAKLSSGRGYTLLVASAPTTVPELNIQVDHATQITETPDGRGKLDFDLSYQFLPQSERAFIGLPGCIATFDLEVILPRKYDDTDLALIPATFTRASDTTFHLPNAGPVSGSGSRAWIAFPNPMTRGSDRAKLMAGLLFGIFTLLFQVQPSRQRKIIWFVSVFIASVTVLAVCAYFTLAIIKKMEFLIFAAAIVPHAVYAAIASLYLLAAKKWQAVLSGQVHIDGAPAQLVQVRLFRTDVNPIVVVQEKDALQDGGRYLFYLWLRGKRKYKVVASYGSVANGESANYELNHGQKQEVPVIKLTTPAMPVKL